MSREKLSNKQKRNTNKSSWFSYMFLEKTNRTKIRIVLCLDSGAGKEWGWDGIHMEEEGYGGREVSRWKRKQIKTKSFSLELT